MIAWSSPLEKGHQPGAHTFVSLMTQGKNRRLELTRVAPGGIDLPGLLSGGAEYG
jgi:hypothetical protein